MRCLDCESGWKVCTDVLVKWNDCAPISRVLVSQHGLWYSCVYSGSHFKATTRCHRRHVAKYYSARDEQPSHSEATFHWLGNSDFIRLSSYTCREGASFVDVCLSTPTSEPGQVCTKAFVTSPKQRMNCSWVWPREAASIRVVRDGTCVLSLALVHCVNLYREVKRFVPDCPRLCRWRR